MPSSSTSQWSCGCSGAVAAVVPGGAGVISLSSSFSVTTSDFLCLFVFFRSVYRVVLLPPIWSRAFFGQMMGSMSSWWLRSGTRSSVVPCVTQYVMVGGPIRPSSVITTVAGPFQRSFGPAPGASRQYNTRWPVWYTYWVAWCFLRRALLSRASLSASMTAIAACFCNVSFACMPIGWH